MSKFYTIIVEYDGQNIGLLRQCITGTNCQSGVFNLIDWWPSNKGVDLFTISSAKLNQSIIIMLIAIPVTLVQLTVQIFIFLIVSALQI